MNVMKKIISHIITVTFLLIAISVVASAQQVTTIIGKVKSGESGQPLYGSYVHIIGTESGAYTDLGGNYTFSITYTSEPVTLAVSQAGEDKLTRTMTLNSGENRIGFWVEAVSDLDNNVYSAVVIGNQVWMGENLRTTKYNDASDITYPGTNNSAWQNNNDGAYAWNNNDITYKDPYGALYNWNAVKTYKLCPTDWHIPSKWEWEILTNFLVGENVAGGKLKEAGTSHWADPNTDATNESGFTGLPSGYRSPFGDGFGDLGSWGNWWSRSERLLSGILRYAGGAWGLTAINKENMIHMIGWNLAVGISVRCIKNDIPVVAPLPISSITSVSAQCGGNVVANGASTVKVRGVCWSTNPGPTSDLPSKTIDDSGTGIFTSDINGLNSGVTYYIRAYATNSEGTAYGDEMSFTTYHADAIKDIDNNYYNIVKIASQTWMAENLKVTKYNNGTAIPELIINSDWNAEDGSIGHNGAYCWYENNDSVYGNTYGALYNWFAVNDGELCPTGWHIPNNSDWATLAANVGGESTAGDKLKEMGTTNWAKPNSGATNEMGFTAEPGGARENTGTFNNVRSNGYWWSSSEFDDLNATCWQMFYNLSNLGSGNSNKKSGYSVRCMQSSLPEVTTTSITSLTPPTAQSGGNITRDGGSPVTARGVCWGTSPGPIVAGNHTSDGTGAGAFTSQVNGLDINTRYYLRAYATNSVGTVYGNEISFRTYGPDVIKDIDGNYYNIGNIGNQVWMLENLKTTKLNDGTVIQNVTDNTQWGHLTTPGMSWFNNDEATFKDTYGAMYNWFAVNKGNLCPVGWKVPTEAEWNILRDQLGGEAIAGGKMKETGTLHWLEPNNSATNSSGFKGLPGGYRNNAGGFGDMGINTIFWTSTDGGQDHAFTKHLRNYDALLFHGWDEMVDGVSVRCIFDPLMVTNKDDSGTGSLRNVIEYANSNPIKDTITFNISGTGPFTIQPLTPLPTITDPVIINGYSQPGASASNSILLIELDGTNTDNTGHRASGLSITSGNCTVKGLVINRFPEAGINIYNTSIGNRIEGNYIGTNINGTAGLGNSAGISVGIAANENKIGGTTLGERNIISGNHVGIVLNESFRNIIKGNYIGVDVSGKLPLGNTTSGVSIQNCGGNIIGGANQNERNIISSNEEDGICGTYVASRNTIKGNYIGTDVTGKLPLGNAGAGIRFGSDGNENLIGGATPGEGNVISDNKVAGISIKSNTNKILGNYLGTDYSGSDQIGNLVGIRVESGASGNQIGDTINGGGNIIAFSKEQGIVVTDITTIHNVILGNSIHSNTGLGIDLGNDGVTPNDIDKNTISAANPQNYPELSSVSFSPGNVKITGKLNSKSGQTYTLQFFTNNIGDETGYGEGQTYLGSKTVTTDGSGNAAFSESFPIYGRDGQTITATATDSLGNTSEFSKAVGGLADQELPGGTLHYVYNETGASKITDGTDITAITDAFQTWTSIPTAKILFYNDGPSTVKYANAGDNVNLVSFVDDQYGWTPGVLAYSAKMVDMDANGGKGKITDADIIVNPEFANYLSTSAGGTSGYYDIQSIITHEIGHNLGLMHSGVVDATMFYWLESGKTDKRSLEPDDVAWASYKYRGASFSDSYGTITGDITYGYDPKPKVIGTLVIAFDATTNTPFHSYSEENGKYVVPVPSTTNTGYYVHIQPLDGSVNGFNITPANISNYIFSNAEYFDYPNEYYNDPDLSDEPPDAQTIVPVTSGLEKPNINFITNIDNTPPTIVSITPEMTNNEAPVVEIQPDIIIKFSEPVDITTFTDASCFLESDAIKYFGSYTKLGGNSDAIIFSPKDPLPYSTTFVLHLIGHIAANVKGITDLRGNELIVTGLNYSVTTVDADNVPPTILSTVPKDGATGVFVTDKVSVSFSEPMNKTSVQDNFALATGSTSISGTFNWNNELTTVTFTPTHSLAENTSYTLTLSDKLTDLHGIRLGGNSTDNDNNVTATFTTVAFAQPKITYRGPADKKTGVTVSTPIVVDFTEPINTSTVDQTSLKLLLNGTSINGSFEFLNDNSRVIFRPDADLQFGKTYTVTLTQSIMDVSNPSQPLDLEGKPTTTFTTVTQPVAPSIYYIDSPSGNHGDEVTIAGEGFDPNPANNKVNFASVSATVTGATLDNLTVKVPTEATSGMVNVSVKNVTTSLGYYFYVIPDVLDLPENWATSSADSKSNPHGVALKTDGALAYVTNPGLNTVSIIDMATLKVTGYFNVGKMPLKIDLNPLCTKAYVTNYGSNTVSVIDLITNSVKEIKVGLNPYGIAVTPTGDRVYVANYSSNNVSVIDINPNSGGFDHVVANVNTGTGNKDLKVTGDAGLALVAGDDGLKIIDIKKKDADYNCVVATASSGTKTKEVNPNGDATLAVVITQEGTLLLVDISPQSDFFGTALASTGSGSNNKGGKPSGEGLHIFVTTENNEVLVYEIGTGGAPSSSGSYAGKITLKQVATIHEAGNGDLIFDTRNEKLVAVYSGTGVNNGGLKITSLLKGPATPESGIAGLIIAVRQLMTDGVVKAAHGKEIINKLYDALNDLQNKKTKNVINDLNAFINKVKAQVPKSQGQPIIDAANIIIKQLQGTKSEDEELNLNDAANQPVREIITETKLGVIYPNPAKEAITVNYEIAENEQGSEKVNIQIYDVIGRLVSNLVNKNLAPGRYTATWNGSFDNGEMAAQGFYFIRFSAGKTNEVKRIIVVR
jgi:uncharacterized protein (TIGR02145 family)